MEYSEPWAWDPYTGWYWYGGTDWGYGYPADAGNEEEWNQAYGAPGEEWEQPYESWYEEGSGWDPGER